MTFISSASLNETEHEQVLECLNESSSSIEELKSFEIGVMRFEDLYELMKNSYEAQMILFNRTGRIDFSYILTNCEKFFEIENQAYLSRDMIKGLEEFYSDLSNEIREKEEIEKLFSEIYSEYENERYEKIEELVDEAYNLIIETKSSETALNIFYESTTKSIKNFFINNYKEIVFTFLILLILFLIFKNLIKRFFLNLKLDRLELRKEVLIKLIKEAQSNYFDKGNLSKDVYEIRLRKFSDLIRDIESQELSLREKVLRNNAKNNFYEKQIEKKKKDVKRLKKKKKKMESRNVKKNHLKAFNKNKKKSERQIRRAERKELRLKKLNEKRKEKRKKKEILEKMKKEKKKKMQIKNKKQNYKSKKVGKKIKKKIPLKISFLKNWKKRKNERIEKKKERKEKRRMEKIEKLNKINLRKNKRKLEKEKKRKEKEILRLRKKETRRLRKERRREERLKEKRLSSPGNYRKFKKKLESY